MDIKEKLRIAGLTGNESKVYLELVKSESISANQIAKNLGIDRTLTYTVLNHLIDKGLVNYVIKDNRKVFSCADLSNLLNPVKSQETIIKELIGDLGKIEKKVNQESRIEIYEGREGLMALMKLMMKSKEILSFGATGRAYDYIYESPSLAKEWIRAKHSARIIANSKYQGHKMKDIKTIEFRYLEVRSDTTTSIFGDYISIHISIEKPLIILIKNKHIAESYRNNFEILWKAAKK